MPDTEQGNFTCAITISVVNKPLTGFPLKSNRKKCNDGFYEGRFCYDLVNAVDAKQRDGKRI